jgi:predicted RNase H-like HicB family nuclease
VNVADYLRVPYLLQSSAMQREDGTWLRRVEYPELPDCVSQESTLLAALDELDRRRVRVILGLLRDGQAPPLPREPLADRDPRAELGRLGLSDLSGLLDADPPDVTRIPRDI